MFKSMLKKILALLVLFCSIHVSTAKKPKVSYKFSKRSTKKAYPPKSPYAGFGKKSTITGKIKTKSVSGHFKPSNRYKFVNPYARAR